MTNIEKSREIAHSYEDDEISVEDMVIACMGMANWKEQDILEKVKTWLKEHAKEYEYAFCDWKNVIYYVDDMLEDFKQAMKEE